MVDDTRNNDRNDEQASGITRREFVGLSLAAGLSAGLASGADLKIVETDVEIKTPDGACDAAFIHPASGSHPGVLIWTDAFGLRPSFREMARRLALQGYSVLVPNPFYRIGKSPFFADASKVDFAKERAKISPLMASINAEGAVENDAPAYIAFLDAQKQVNKSKKIGTQGYCMGGALVMRTAATVSARVGVGASFHGGGLMTDKPNSPHLLVPKIKAKMYFGIAANDDKNLPDVKVKLKEAFEAAHNPAEIEVYSESLHGWCVPDMPASQNGVPIYNKPDAERAWGKLSALYKSALA
jgi:carboxymethylenebutenolidase